MGIKIRGRSPAEQALYESILPRLCAGESAAKISREHGIPVQTIRAWKSRAKARNGGRLPGTEERAPALITPTLSAPPAMVSAENVREFLLGQGEVAAPLLQAFGQEMECGLKSAHSALLRALEVITKELTEETKEIVMSGGAEEGSYIGTIRKNPADTAHTIKALSTIVERFAAFHCIPHGALKTESLRFGPAAVSNHLHLHSHGSKANGAARALPPKELAPIDVTPSHSELMTGNQAEMLEALDD